MDEQLDPWYYIDWFFPSTFSSFTWTDRFWLWLIPVIPLLFVVRWLTRYYLNQKLPVALVKSDLRSNPVNLVRLVPEILLAIVGVLILVALARPQRTNEKVEQWTEGIDIMLAIDISQSMQIEDFQPNRLESAKGVARNFIKGRVQDRIGIGPIAGHVCHEGSSR